MNPTEQSDSIIGFDDLILVTGATGFIGRKVIENLMGRGFRRIRCLVRPSTSAPKVKVLSVQQARGVPEVFRGNLLSREDCAAATDGAKIVLHLAAGRGEKSYPDAFLNSVVTTRNLLDACLTHLCLERFVNMSSFTVYDNAAERPGHLLDESCPIEPRPQLRGEAYCFAKTRQDELLAEYGKLHNIPYVILRPGWVYGPGNLAITGRVGVGTFGLFLHLGGSNTIPLTYVDNCAEAVVLAGLKPGISGEVFNVVDDDLPSSRKFLRLYKQQVKRFPSLYLPKLVSYSLCGFWERYSAWSEGQLPPAFNRSRWNSIWRKTAYTNQKLKTRLGWRPIVSTQDGLRNYFAACRAGESHA